MTPMAHLIKKQTLDRIIIKVVVVDASRTIIRDKKLILIATLVVVEALEAAEVAAEEITITEAATVTITKERR